MHVYFGRQRCTIVTRNWACKFPKPNITALPKSIGTQMVSYLGGQITFKSAFTGIYHCFLGVVRSWKLGWQKNLLEARASDSLAGLAVKTHFSCWGLVNFCQAAQPSSLRWLELVKAMQDKLDQPTYCSAAQFSHQLNARTNLGILNGRLVFVDYGTPGFADFVLANRQSFAEIFNQFQSKG
ncbi:hypothetical protein A2311_00065 [candidate division WOR-1 bacterium RIFOXYB2_FULL_48_7]|uniref:Uncharacterized protein n=1 Tax=candidate division WOR-1 bacterium RIFOXYB2_FULL_48_7 TaxID=1802583 RepID=A0A1F4TJI6_UNCSA|nr:MAG: hypothetical protein A2311_00065 [candidate division WOR-1 bacterium RIFOXYB2_FULL_48_7]